MFSQSLINLSNSGLNVPAPDKSSSQYSSINIITDDYGSVYPGIHLNYRSPTCHYDYRFGDIQDYIALLSPDTPTCTLKGESVTFLTTDYREKEATVEADDLQIKDGRLSWSAVTDERHCYYRVYAANTPSFEPSRQTQIASTVGTDIPIENPDLFYRVLSVDCDGNV